MSEENTSIYQNMTLSELKNTAINEIKKYFESKENIANDRMAPSMIVNAYWDLAKSSEEIKKKIIDEHEKYTEIYADVVSSLENPNCSCRSRFATFIAENKENTINSYLNIVNLLSDEYADTLKEVLKKQLEMFEHFKAGTVKVELKNNNEDIQESEENIQKNETFPFYLEGNVIEIGDSPEEYGNLIKSLRQNGEFYKGINLVPKPNNKIWVYFY